MLKSPIRQGLIKLLRRNKEVELIYISAVAFGKIKWLARASISWLFPATSDTTAMFTNGEDVGSTSLPLVCVGLGLYVDTWIKRPKAIPLFCRQSRSCFRFQSGTTVLLCYSYIHNFLISLRSLYSVFIYTLKTNSNINKSEELSIESPCTGVSE